MSGALACLGTIFNPNCKNEGSVGEGDRRQGEGSGVAVRHVYLCDSAHLPRSLPSFSPSLRKPPARRTFGGIFAN